MDARIYYLVALAELERAAQSFALAGIAAAEQARAVEASVESNGVALQTIERCRGLFAEAITRAPGLRHLFP